MRHFSVVKGGSSCQVIFGDLVSVNKAIREIDGQDILGKIVTAVRCDKIETPDAPKMVEKIQIEPVKTELAKKEYECDSDSSSSSSDHSTKEKNKRRHHHRRHHHSKSNKRRHH